MVWYRTRQHSIEWYSWYWLIIVVRIWMGRWYWWLTSFLSSYQLKSKNYKRVDWPVDYTWGTLLQLRSKTYWYPKLRSSTTFAQSFSQKPNFSRSRLKNHCSLPIPSSLASLVFQRNVPVFPWSILEHLVSNILDFPNSCTTFPAPMGDGNLWQTDLS